jgi:hypothetical protein
MEDKVSISKQSTLKPLTLNSSNKWMAFWLIFFMLIGIGGAGYYLDLRLASFEEKVLTQTTDVSQQAKSTLIALQQTRKEVLENRQESAAFAQKFSNTLKGVSVLLTQTVNAFSEQTLQLTKAIEKKDRSQSASFQTAMADISKEMAATRQATLEAKTKTDSIEQQLEMLSSQLQEVSGDLSSGFTTLTQLSEKMNQVVTASLDEKTKALNGQLAHLQNASQQSLESVEEKLMVLDQYIQVGFADGAGEYEALQLDIAEMSYNLDGRMEDLLVGLVDSGNHEKSLTLENLAGIESRLNSLSSNFQLLRSELGEQLSDAVQVFSISSQDQKLQQTAVQLKNLGQDIQSLQQSVQTKIESTQNKAAKWINTPESQEAKDDFELEILEFTELMQSTCNQVESIQKQISGLAGQLDAPLEEASIGMLPTTVEGNSE